MTRTLALLATIGAMAATPAAADAATLFFPASVPPGTSSTPLPDARAAAISESGIFVNTGDVLTIQVSGTASGGPGFTYYDANGVPGSPVSDGEFPRIVGPPANIYSLIATIVPPGNNDHLTGINDEWFLVGTANSITATRSGELQFASLDALYRSDWAPAYTDNDGGFTVTFGVNDTDLDGIPDVNDLETRSPTKTVAPVLTGEVLDDGQPYVVTVEGTYSAYNANQMAGLGGFVVCGSPEPAPLFPSPGVTNGRVGVDSEFRFANPLPGKKCQPKHGLVKHDTKVRFSTDGGATWFTPTATDAGAAPDADHTYSYPVTGDGQALQARVQDSNYTDNYGQFKVTSAPAAP